MSAAQREPGAKTGTEGTEVRKASSGAGFKAMDGYGKGTEEVRKHSSSLFEALHDEADILDLASALESVVASAEHAGQSLNDDAETARFRGLLTAARMLAARVEASFDARCERPHAPPSVLDTYTHARALRAVLEAAAQSAAKEGADWLETAMELDHAHALALAAGTLAQRVRADLAHPHEAAPPPRSGARAGRSRAKGAPPAPPHAAGELSP
jgi:hypothetical protein